MFIDYEPDENDPYWDFVKQIEALEKENEQLRQLIASNYRVMKADILKELDGRKEEKNAESVSPSTT